RWRQPREQRAPPGQRAQQTFRSWCGERDGEGGVLFRRRAVRPEGSEVRSLSRRPRSRGLPPPRSRVSRREASRTASRSWSAAWWRSRGPLERTTTQEVCGRFPRRDHAGQEPIRPPTFARSPLPRRSPELGFSVYHVFWLASRDIALARGRPCAKASRFSAMARKRRSQVPSVWPEAWGVITTFGSSWNANCEARTRWPEAGGYLYQTSIVAPRMRPSASAA